MVVTLKCPGCGSAVPHGSTVQTCSYCGSSLWLNTPETEPEPSARPDSARPAKGLEYLLREIDEGSFNYLHLYINEVLIQEPENGNVWLCAAVAAMGSSSFFKPGAETEFLQKARELRVDHAVAERVLTALLRKAARYAEHLSLSLDYLRFAYRIGETPEMPEVLEKMWQWDRARVLTKGESSAWAKDLREVSVMFRRDHPEWNIPAQYCEPSSAEVAAQKAARRELASNIWGLVIGAAVLIWVVPKAFDGSIWAWVVGFLAFFWAVLCWVSITG